MASSSAPLQLFPSITHTTQPRKSSLKKKQPTETGNLHGNALLIQTTPGAPGLTVQPANDKIKHTLFCDPSSSEQHTISNRGTPKRQLRTRRRSSGESSIVSASNLNGTTTPPSLDEDQLSELPVNNHFGPGRPARAQLQRPKLPQKISTEAQPDLDQLTSPGGDTVSPLPSKLHFATTSPRRAEFPKRSVSPNLSRSDSTTSAAPPYSPPAMRSIFPQYDPTKPLQEQHYYPPPRSVTPNLPTEKVSKVSTPVEKSQTFDRVDSAVALVDGYEHIPYANNDDLLAVWNASCGNFPVPGRKVQIGLLQPRNSGTSLAIGNSEDAFLYSMSKEALPSSSKEPSPQKQLVIKKNKPQLGKAPSSPLPVAQMALPDPAKPIKDRETDVVAIFPQLAAIKAIEDVANSPQAASIATFDPSARSPEAARLAKDAVFDAHRRHRCDLVRNTRKRDSLGAVTASYRLEHPTVGSFAITVTKSTIGRHSRDPRAKISIHHPSATPAAVMSETLVLAFIDFARDACVLDTPGLLALESEYIIDTIVCALLTVAVIENDALMAETLTFAAPPKSPLPLQKGKPKSSGSTRSSSSNESKRSSGWLKKKDKKKKVAQEEQVELPVLTQGALALLGLSFKTAVFVLEAGVKVTAGLVIGASHLAKKL